MTQALKIWWRSRTPRERALLSGMSVLLALVLAWLLLVRPLNAGLADARARHELAVLRLAEVRAQAAAIRRIETRRPPAIAEPLDGLISRSAAEAGFQPLGIRTEAPGRVSFSMSAVRAQAFFGWLGRMEAQGLSVGQLSATPNADQTLAVQVTLRARGG
jgi:type II secretory pathway component PulM